MTLQEWTTYFERLGVWSKAVDPTGCVSSVVPMGDVTSIIGSNKYSTRADITIRRSHIAHRHLNSRCCGDEEMMEDLMRNESMYTLPYMPSSYPLGPTFGPTFFPSSRVHSIPSSPPIPCNTARTNTITAQNIICHPALSASVNILRHHRIILHHP